MIFRPFDPSDLPELAAVLADAETVRYVDDGQPSTRDEAALWIERSRENVARFGWGTGAVVEIASGRLIGWGGFARPEGQPEELIYGLARTHWGRGLGPELAEALVQYGTKALGLRELRATVHPANAVSAKILTRLGFVRVEWNATDAHLYILR